MIACKNFATTLTIAPELITALKIIGYRIIICITSNPMGPYTLNYLLSLYFLWKIT